MSRNRKVHLPAEAAAEAGASLPLDRPPVGHIDLVFTEPEALDHVDKPLWCDVSTLAVAGRSIFCTCDETATVERVLVDGRARATTGHVNFPLGAVFDLAGGARGEMDIEGLAIADGYLWVCGSHSLKRDGPDGDRLGAMAEIDWDANRGFLGRIPLVDRGDGVFDLAAEDSDRRAAMLRMTRSRKTPLRRLLAADPLLGPFVDLPCKENGLDIEGLAVSGGTLLLGLRGPVLKGWALIVRLEMKRTAKGRLKPRKLADGRRYALQALDLNGQGIRDLLWEDGRLLILSGATTDLEALQSVFAIEDYDPERAVFGTDDLRRVLDLPVIRGSDHAEGLAILRPRRGKPKLVVAYDSPHNDRTDPGAHRLTVDLFALGG